MYLTDVVTNSTEVDDIINNQSIIGYSPLSALDPNFGSPVPPTVHIVMVALDKHNRFNLSSGPQ